ncbi:hypothetical protein BDF19DRAFT_419699 [Syncephalis fuscata]|nr:hypothetical protein BDF19DRAFT_419699 [Syncephalis fuscata]
MQSGPSPTFYDSYTIRHFNPSNFTHGFPQFLPWHRAFILDFENQLKRIDESLTIPYWDWSYDSQAPELAPIWRSDWYGGNGRDSDSCVVNGQFANWHPFYPEPHCLRRRWDNNDTISAYYSPEMIQSIKNNAHVFDEFRQQLEAPPHNQVHVSIGGDMPTLYSPNDPIFWSHHAFVDKLWAEWQEMAQPNVMSYNGINGDGTQAKLSDQLLQLNYSVADVMVREKLCYEYVPAPWEANFPGKSKGRGNNNGTPHARRDIDNSTDSAASSGYTFTQTNIGDNDGTPNANDRHELLQLRVPNSLPEASILRSHMKVEDVRRAEEIHRQTIYELNKLSNYISPAALINRPEFMESLTGRVDRFTATDDKQQLQIHLPNKTPLSQKDIGDLVRRIYSRGSNQSVSQKADADIETTSTASSDIDKIIGTGTWERIWSTISAKKS